MTTIELIEMIAMWKERAEKAEAELSALKIDARYIAENWERTDNDYNTKCGVDEVAERILEATKDEP